VVWKFVHYWWKRGTLPPSMSSACPQTPEIVAKIYASHSYEHTLILYKHTH